MTEEQKKAEVEDLKKRFSKAKKGHKFRVFNAAFSRLHKKYGLTRDEINEIIMLTDK